MYNLIPSFIGFSLGNHWLRGLKVVFTDVQIITKACISSSWFSSSQIALTWFPAPQLTTPGVWEQGGVAAGKALRWALHQSSQASSFCSRRKPRQAFCFKPVLKRAYWSKFNLIVRLKEEKKHKAKPNWEWTLAYAGNKSQSFKLHCCLSSLHMLVLLAGEITGRVWFSKPWIAQVYALQLLFCLLTCRRLPCVTQLMAALLQGWDPDAKILWLYTEWDSASSQHEAQLSQTREFQGLHFFFPLVFSLTTYHLAHRSKQTRKCLGKTNSSHLGQWGEDQHLGLCPRKCHAARQRYFLQYHQWFGLPIIWCRDEMRSLCLYAAYCFAWVQECRSSFITS